MAKPLIPADDIYEHALALLDREGPDALTTRRVAADLRISTRTLYQQTGSRDELIRAVVARHFSRLKLEFHESDNWQDTCVQWCLTLQDALRSHPHLTRLMSVADRKPVMDFISRLTRSTLREGVPRGRALELSGALVNLTINQSVMDVRAMQDPTQSHGSAAADRRAQRGFEQTVRWICAGVLAEIEN
jgi:AcrR family transcriptional regulator